MVILYEEENHSNCSLVFMIIGIMFYTTIEKGENKISIEMPH